MHLLFYRSASIGALLIRTFTRRRGQPWGEVPSHVAIEIGGVIREAHAPKGVTSRAYNALRETMDAQVPVPASEEAESAAEQWLIAQVGKPYDWWAIFADVVGMVLPRRGRISSTTQERWDCSRLVAGAMAAGGRDIGAGRTPVSPNDLWLMTQAWAVTGAGAGVSDTPEKDGK